MSRLMLTYKKRRGLTFFIFMFWLSLVYGKDKKPNIILIIADDLSPDYLGCYGGPTPTPHLDRLAEGGARFTNAHAVSALSNPSRYTILTGQFPGRNPNVIKQSAPDAPYYVGQNTEWTNNEPSIARSLKSKGYLTGYIGKWHSNFSALEGGEELPSGLDKDAAETTRLLSDIQQKHIAAVKQISGFDHVACLQVGNLDGKAKTNPWMGHHNPEWLTQGALDFIDSAGHSGKPFFLHLANSMPHSPDNIESLKQDPRYTVAGKLNQPSSSHPSRNTVFERLAAAGLNTSGHIASINAGTIALDDQLGAVIKRLEELGIAENTLIIWFADHSIYGKGSCYSPGTRVPLIAWWPAQIKGGCVVETAVSLVDVFNTCMSAAHAGLSGDGNDLLPLINGPAETERSVYQEIGWHRGVVCGRYHYVAFRPAPDAISKMQHGEIAYAVDQPSGVMRNIFGDLNLPFKPAWFDADQLYDLQTDPLERHNLAYHPAYAAVLADMKTRLAAFTARFERQFPSEAPEFLLSPEYQQLVANRKKIAEEKEHYPEKYDAERIFNYNLYDPLAR